MVTPKEWKEIIGSTFQSQGRWLQSFKLRSCGFQNSHISEIISALSEFLVKSHREIAISFEYKVLALDILDLSYNPQIEKEGWYSLIKLLFGSVHISLRQLLLKSCSINNIKAQYFLNGLKDANLNLRNNSDMCLRCVEEIDLSENPIPQSLQIIIQKSFLLATILEAQIFQIQEISPQILKMLGSMEQNKEAYQKTISIKPESNSQLQMKPQIKEIKIGSESSKDIDIFLSRFLKDFSLIEELIITINEQSLPKLIKVLEELVAEQQENSSNQNSNHRRGDKEIAQFDGITLIFEVDPINSLENKIFKGKIGNIKAPMLQKNIQSIDGHYDREEKKYKQLSLHSPKLKSVKFTEEQKNVQGEKKLHKDLKEHRQRIRNISPSLRLISDTPIFSKFSEYHSSVDIKQSNDSPKIEEQNELSQKESPKINFEMDFSSLINSEIRKEDKNFFSLPSIVYPTITKGDKIKTIYHLKKQHRRINTQAFTGEQFQDEEERRQEEFFLRKEGLGHIDEACWESVIQNLFTLSPFKKLSIQKCHVDSRLFAKISEITSLEVLDLSGNKRICLDPNGKRIKALAQLEGKKEDPIWGQGLELTFNLQQLQEISFANTDIGSGFAKRLAEVLQKSCQNLNGNKFLQNKLIFLIFQANSNQKSELLPLKKINLSGASEFITSNEWVNLIHALLNYTQLTKLILVSCNFSRGNVQGLINGLLYCHNQSYLEEVILSGNKGIYPNDWGYIIANLFNRFKIKTLDISNCAIYDQKLEKIINSMNVSKLKSLEVFNFSSNRVDNPNHLFSLLNLLIQAPSIQEINLQDCKLNKRSTELLNDQFNLFHLISGNLSVSLKVLKLSSNPSLLDSLTHSYSFIYSLFNHIPIFFTNLSELYLDNCLKDQQKVFQFQSSLLSLFQKQIKLKSLHTLSISGNRIYAQQFSELIPLITNVAVLLKTLMIGNNKIIVQKIKNKTSSEGKIFKNAIQGIKEGFDNVTQQLCLERLQVFISHIFILIQYFFNQISDDETVNSQDWEEFLKVLFSKSGSTLKHMKIDSRIEQSIKEQQFFSSLSRLLKSKQFIIQNENKQKRRQTKQLLDIKSIGYYSQGKVFVIASENFASLRKYGFQPELESGKICGINESQYDKLFWNSSPQTVLVKLHNKINLMKFEDSLQINNFEQNLKVRADLLIAMNYLRKNLNCQLSSSYYFLPLLVKDCEKTKDDSLQQTPHLYQQGDSQLNLSQMKELTQREQNNQDQFSWRDQSIHQLLKDKDKDKDNLTPYSLQNNISVQSKEKQNQTSNTYRPSQSATVLNSLVKKNLVLDINYSYKKLPLFCTSNALCNPLTFSQVNLRDLLRGFGVLTFEYPLYIFLVQTCNLNPCESIADFFVKLVKSLTCYLFPQEADYFSIVQASPNFFLTESDRDKIQKALERYKNSNSNALIPLNTNLNISSTQNQNTQGLQQSINSQNLAPNNFQLSESFSRRKSVQQPTFSSEHFQVVQKRKFSTIKQAQNYGQSKFLQFPSENQAYSFGNKDNSQPKIFGTRQDLLHQKQQDQNNSILTSGIQTNQQNQGSSISNNNLINQQQYLGAQSSNNNLNQLNNLVNSQYVEDYSFCNKSQQISSQNQCFSKKQIPNHVISEFRLTQQNLIIDQQPTSIQLSPIKKVRSNLSSLNTFRSRNNSTYQPPVGQKKIWSVLCPYYFSSRTINDLEEIKVIKRIQKMPPSELELKGMSISAIKTIYAFCFSNPYFNGCQMDYYHSVFVNTSLAWSLRENIYKKFLSRKRNCFRNIIQRILFNVFSLMIRDNVFYKYDSSALMIDGYYATTRKTHIFLTFLIIFYQMLTTIVPFAFQNDKGTTWVAHFIYIVFSIFTLIVEYILIRDLLHKILHLAPGFNLFYQPKSLFMIIKEQLASQTIVNYKLLIYMFYLINSQFGRLNTYSDICFLVLCLATNSTTIFFLSTTLVVLNKGIAFFRLFSFLLKSYSSSAKQHLPGFHITKFYEAAIQLEFVGFSELLNIISPYCVTRIPKNSLTNCLIPKISGQSMNQRIFYQLLRIIFEDLPQIILQIIFLIGETNVLNTFSSKAYISLVLSFMSFSFALYKVFSIRPSIISQLDFDELKIQKQRDHIVVLQQFEQNEQKMFKEFMKIQNGTQQQQGPIIRIPSKFLLKQIGGLEEYSSEVQQISNEH